MDPLPYDSESPFKSVPPPGNVGRQVALSIEKWRALTPKQQWDTLVALRGPDVGGSEIVKWFTTSVIRGKLRNILRIGGQVNMDLDMVVVPHGGMVGKDYIGPTGGWKHDHDHDPCDYCENLAAHLERLESLRRWDSRHFFQHVSEAADVIGLKNLSIPGDVWQDAMDAGGPRRAGKMILAYLGGKKERGEDPHILTCYEDLNLHIQWEGWLG